METFKDRFNYILEETGVTLTKIYKVTGIPQNTLSNYKTGRMEPRTDRLTLLAKFFNVNEVWLMGYDIDPERKNPETAEEKRNEIAFLFNLLSPGEQQTVIELIHHLADKQQ